MDPILLNAWAIHQFDDHYKAPEQIRKLLSGVRADSPNGARIDPAPFSGAVGRIVTMEDCTVYQLGEPDAPYAEWCRATGIVIDPENPIRILGD